MLCFLSQSVIDGKRSPALRERPIGATDLVDIIVSPTTDAQMGFAYNFTLRPTTSIVTGKYEPVFLKVPQLAKSAYYSFYAARDGLAILLPAAKQ